MGPPKGVPLADAEQRAPPPRSVALTAVSPAATGCAAAVGNVALQAQVDMREAASTRKAGEGLWHSWSRVCKKAGVPLVRPSVRSMTNSQLAAETALFQVFLVWTYDSMWPKRHTDKCARPESAHAVVLAAWLALVLRGRHDRAPAVAQGAPHGQHARGDVSLSDFTVRG
jgi:hypothetical protein